MYNINWTSEKQKEVLNLLDIYFKKYPYGETIFQSDTAQEESLQLLSEISDIIQPTRSDNGQSSVINWDNSFGDHAIF
jgi:hypothetical protein